MGFLMDTSITNCGILKLQKKVYSSFIGCWFAELCFQENCFDTSFYVNHVCNYIFAAFYIHKMTILANTGKIKCLHTKDSLQYFNTLLTWACCIYYSNVGKGYSHIEICYFKLNCIIIDFIDFCLCAKY